MILIPNNTARLKLGQARPKLNDPADILDQAHRLTDLKHLAGQRVEDLAHGPVTLMDDIVPAPVTLPGVDRFAGTRINRLFIPHPQARRHLVCDRFQDVFLVYQDNRFCIFRKDTIDLRSTALPGREALRAMAAGQVSDQGRGAYCGDHFLPGNPAHFVADHLTRALIFRDRVGLPADKIHLPESAAPVCTVLQDRIDPRLSTLAPGRVHFFSELNLLSSSRFDRPHGHPFWYLDPDILALVRAAAQRDFQASGSKTRRIYLGRTDTARRRMLNEAALIDRLQKLGVEPVLMSQLSGSGQLAAVHEADLIIAPHGGALLNLIAARQGTRVIELFTPERGTLAFAGLALALGLKYEFQFGQPADPPEKHDLPWTADIKALCAAIGAP